MKTLLNVLLTLPLAVIFFEAHSQDKKPLSPGYYIVVSAYAQSNEAIAQGYVEVLAKQGIKADYGFNESTMLYLVYLQYFDNLKGSLQEMQQTRKNGRFTDAWVRVVPGDIVAKADNAANNEAGAKPVANAVAEVAVVEEAKDSAAGVEVTPEDSVIVTDNPEIKQYKQMTLGNTEVFLSLFHARNNRIVDGFVQVIDTDRAKFLTKVKGNEYLLLPDPKSNSGKLTLICEAFGYRRVQEELNYPVPLADTVKQFIDLMGTTVVVKFDLVRYYKGDKAIMYNVFFYNDASIMAPESKYELNSLLQMMQEVPTYKIRLHGHTNGNYHGRILSMGPEKNFFSLDGSTNSIGSAKDLSRNRAESIQEYLISNGISADRISIKAWGGKKPLYDKRSVNAKKNVRVEVEILEN